MNRDWKPGDVAMVTAANRPIPYRAYWDVDAEGHGLWREYDSPNSCLISCATARLLVVIDPEDAEQIGRLARALPLEWNLFQTDDPELGVDSIAGVAAALREFADPTPRIEQPTGLGAVVESAGGLQFVRMHDGWWRGDEPCTVNWAATHAVRVLSEGAPS